tara:strand:- start:388 stop:618 length:231 start_codon:yes stop_codon:yes gene_type:complete
MNILDQTFFAPLGKEYCAYFYWLTVISFLMLAMAVVHSALSLFEKKAKLLPSLLGLIGPVLLYFSNRLLYSMCVGR